MKLLKIIGLVGALVLGFSGVASATYLPNNYHYHHGGCGNQGNTCDTPFTKTLETTDINTKTHWGLFGKYNTSQWSFDSVNAPGLNIDNATLKVQSNATGYYKFDNLFSGLNFIGHLSGGIDVFNVADSLFDKIMSGLSLTAIFNTKYESVSWSQLTVNGTYCPPVSEVPVPAALWLFAPALMGFTALRRRAKKSLIS